MKRRFTILTAALALLTFLAVPMGMRGQETVTATSTTMTASVSYQDLETGKLIEYKNSASNSYSNPLRIYSGNTFTIHAKEGVEKITQIAIVANSTSYATATGNATWTATGEGSCSATASVSGSNVTVAITGTATTVTCKPSAQVRWNQLSVTYVTSGTPPAITYTMTYDANGGTGTMTDDDSPYDANATVTVLDNEFTREHFDFVKWNTKADGTGTDYDEGDTFTIRDNTTLYAQWESDGTAGEGSICFSNQSSCTVINGQSVTGEDNLGNTWTITTVGTSSFTSNSGYYQVGSGNSPATSITFTTTLDEEVNVTDFSAMFGGFSATRASVVLKVDDTQVGSGTLNGAADVTVSSSSAQIGTTLTVIVTPTAGGVKCYNISYTYETIDNPAVATTTTINVPQDFNTDIYQGTTAGTLTATVKDNNDNAISGATVTWSSSNTGVATIDANGEVTLVAVGTTTITASYAGVEDEYRPSTGTYELTVIDSNAPGTQNNPYTVAQARAAIDAGTGTQGVYATGIVSSIETAWNTQYSNITFNFVDNAGDTDFLQAYRCVSGTGVDASTVAVGDIVVVHGNLTKYGSTYEFGQGCQLVSLIHPAVPSITVNPDEVNVDATPAAGEDFIEGTLDLTWENLEITDFFEDFAIQYYDAEGEELADDPNWIMVDLATQDPNIGEGYLVSYMIEENEGTEARTAYFKVFALGDEDYVYSNLVAITQAAYENPNCTWDLSIDSYASASDNQVSWTSNFATMTIDKGESTTNANNYLGGTNNRTSTRFYTSSILTLSPVSGYVITSVVFTATTSGYANALGNSTWTNATASVNETVVTVTPTDGAIAMSATIGATCGFTQVKVYYLPAYRLTITGYTGQKDHYFLIASPVTVDPATVSGMTTGDFDLYYFDQAQEDEWRNYEATPFNLVPGTGYLYAKKATTENPTYTFQLTGTPYAGNGTIDLDYDANAEFPGFNLIGNPFGTNANLDQPYYRLNSDGSALNTSTESTQVLVMEGVFVEATSTIRTATFSPAAKRVSQLNVKVTRDRSAVLDNAIIRFDNGAVLGKFQLNPNSTKLYITEGNQDYAVVRSNNAGEMPVSFKAAEDGNYTLSIETENVDASYLHLIDNMTGADVNLLATPSYSFEARTTDYANRFRLVFNTNGVEENTMSNFAYFNGSSWTIDNMGEATLQVVDMMGRVISTETISGNTEVNLNQAAGVYMLRLVTGNDVKVQKVVVR